MLSKSEARRLIGNKGLKINNILIVDEKKMLTENDFKVLGNLISDVICGFKNNISDNEIENEVNRKIIDICKKYPIY